MIVQIVLATLTGLIFFRSNKTLNPYYCLEIDLSKFNQLGFKPDYSIEKALEETIEFYDLELRNKINY